MITDRQLMKAFRRLPQRDRVELSGLDMTLEDQERNRGLWLEFVQGYAKRHWKGLRQLKQKAITQKEYAWCQLLELLRAPGHGQGKVLRRPPDDRRFEAVDARSSRELTRQKRRSKRNTETLDKVAIEGTPSRSPRPKGRWDPMVDRARKQMAQAARRRSGKSVAKDRANDAQSQRIEHFAPAYLRLQNGDPYPDAPVDSFAVCYFVGEGAHWVYQAAANREEAEADLKALMDSKEVTRHLLENGPHAGLRSPVIWMVRKMSEDLDDWITIKQTEGAREYVDEHL
jgi:hypothetical protein